MVGWFEIPVSDMERAVKFYNAVFLTEIKSMQFGKEMMAWFPGVEGAPGACRLIDI